MSRDPTKDDPRKAQRRERQVEATREEIRAAAWAQVAGQGASALSLRAVAASMGLSAPALYRYFPSKADLVTSLILDAFSSLAQAQDGVARDLAGRPWQERLCELGRAYRRWATARPEAFFLIFGDPVPGYEPPWERTMPVAGSSLTAMIGVLTEARERGELALPLSPPASPGLAASLAAWSEAVHRTEPELLYLAFTVASRVQGLMLVELGRQLPPFFPDGAELYERELARIVREVESRPGDGDLGLA